MRGSWHGSLQKGFGTRREPVLRRKQTSLQHYGKKKDFPKQGVWANYGPFTVPGLKGKWGGPFALWGYNRQEKRNSEICVQNLFNMGYLTNLWSPYTKNYVILVQQICSLIKSVCRAREIFSAPEWLVEKRVSFPTLWPVQDWAGVILCLFSVDGLPAVKHGYYFAPYILLNKQKVGQQHVWHVCDKMYGLTYSAAWGGKRWYEWYAQVW